MPNKATNYSTYLFILDNIKVIKNKNNLLICFWSRYFWCGFVCKRDAENKTQSN